MKEVWSGVESLLDNYAKIQNTDFVAVIYSPDSCESAAWVSAALEYREIEYQRIWMLPLEDTDFEERLIESLPSNDKLKRRLVILTFEKDTMSHTTSLLSVMKRYSPESIVAIRAISAGPELFSVGLQPAPKDLEARNTYLMEQIMNAKTLKITTPGGSNFTVSLDPGAHRWISNRGRLRPGAVMVIPAGEVATYPVSVDGTFIADFAFNINKITEEDVRLNNCPVHMTFKDGKLQSLECDDSRILEFLKENLSSQCSARVGELGFGTNFAVANPIAMNSHVNERCPGVHLGLGQHNQDPSVVGYQCAVHLDLIAKGGDVWIDGNRVVDLSDIPMSPNAHPEFTTDEDVFSPEAVDDCCGILQCDSDKTHSNAHE